MVLYVIRVLTGQLKKQTTRLRKSGIYEIYCDSKYVSQAKRK